MQPTLSGQQIYDETTSGRSLDRAQEYMQNEQSMDDGLQHLIERVVGGELLHPAPQDMQGTDDFGETPVEGARAVARWIALHDRACDLRAGLRLDNVVDTRRVKRAVRSLFLYEHQLTAKTRRRARTILWQRDQTRPLPQFITRARWSQCRCPRCQPSFWTASTPALSQSPLLQTA